MACKGFCVGFQSGPQLGFGDAEGTRTERVKRALDHAEIKLPIGCLGLDFRKQLGPKTVAQGQ